MHRMIHIFMRKKELLKEMLSLKSSVSFATSNIVLVLLFKGMQIILYV